MAGASTAMAVVTASIIFMVYLFQLDYWASAR